ncbi:probable protein phosphatase 2C 33 isoform X2 [Zingiber officinale]|uniref:probable protein phosphatase 2C 33 isoform X2 n=1 Tax=Zingiber officinale TaxID=94328 RepID=UPI001C4C1CF6|nr:probable protein phosphatase 2C 33 isoform X2 [Zingiber officinale]
MGSCLSSPEDEELHGIPGRMCLNGATSAASLFTQQGTKGTNQDAMIVWENFDGRSDTVFCGVFDGHGPNGHMVARKVRDILPLNLRANSPSARASDGHLHFFKAWKDSFLKAFRVVDKELRLHPEIDCFCSGTTAVALVKQGQELVIGNVGDSRAVLGTRDENNSLIAVQLTRDLKPSLPREAERIRRHRGRVFALKNEPEVARVWLPNKDSPGLAMARAFGDFCLKDFGLISVPEVSYRRVTAKDEFVVLATDGVWDALSNKDVVSIVASAPTRSSSSSSARSLVESAALAWKFKYPTSKIDDCAVVCLFLNSDESSSSTANSKEDGRRNDIEVAIA